MFARATIIAVCVMITPSVSGNYIVQETIITTTTGSGAWGDPCVRTTRVFRTGEGSQIVREVRERSDSNTTVVPNTNGELSDYKEEYSFRYEFETKDFQWNRPHLNDAMGTNVVSNWSGFRQHIWDEGTYDDWVEVQTQRDMHMFNIEVAQACTLEPPVDATFTITGTEYLEFKVWDSKVRWYLTNEEMTSTDIVTMIKTGTEIVRVESVANPWIADVTTTTFFAQWDAPFQIWVQGSTVTTTTEEINPFPPPPPPMLPPPLPPSAPPPLV